MNGKPKRQNSAASRIRRYMPAEKDKAPDPVDRIEDEEGGGG